MTIPPHEERERTLANKLVDAEKEVKKQLSLKTQLLSGQVNPKDMQAIEKELQQEHEQLMLERRQEIAALKEKVHRLDTLVTELQQQQQQQQQQGLLSSFFSCTCGGSNEDSTTEQAITAPR
ncbi:hypothetical protein, conserved [Eimeria maxima]|uniref:Uncharacterized protein n=1 Tax=Eimeria maxima TaxID=5804 RepID=U6M335_EIMMA|nr:hypothetical protein, conserved [Eimeria maxima]CDJ57488.1 hypothetical protein, conserved [Eimeria maxima]